MSLGEAVEAALEVDLDAAFRDALHHRGGAVPAELTVLRMRPGGVRPEPGRPREYYRPLLPGEP